MPLGVHKVYFVTCGQRPDWLNLEYDKLVFVTHAEFIPDQYLPTYNSHTIELNLWRIPGLSEHFLYFNDDYFLNRPVQKDDFFRRGLPKLVSLAIPFCFQYHEGIDLWSRMLLNDIAVINTTFDIRKAIRTNPEKFFSFVYHRVTKYNKRIYDDAYLAGMRCTHSVLVYRKSVFPEIWEQVYHTIDQTCLSMFRNPEQVTSFLPELWQIFKGEYYPVNFDYFGPVIGLSHQKISDAIKAIKIKGISDYQSK